VTTTRPAVSWTVRRLLASDATAYQRLRLEGFGRHPREFRVALEDEQALRPDAVADRWGFSVYGTEPRAIKLRDGYLDEPLMQCPLA